MKGSLFIIATPIGNLQDITERAQETLRSVDLILCEDTRVTQNLLSRYAITTKTKSFHQYSNSRRYQEILSLLQDGQQIALVTDAGTPGICDPGNQLIEHVTRNMEHVAIVPVPGASAVVTALSISGFPTDKFLFLGFPPHKNKRKKFFEEVASCQYTTVFYESNHRIHKAIGELALLLDPKRQLCVCRELTKKFESIYRGTIAEIQAASISEKGEFVVVIAP